MHFIIKAYISKRVRSTFPDCPCERTITMECHSLKKEVTCSLSKLEQVLETTAGFNKSIEVQQELGLPVCTRFPAPPLFSLNTNLNILKGLLTSLNSLTNISPGNANHLDRVRINGSGSTLIETQWKSSLVLQKKRTHN